MAKKLQKTAPLSTLEKMYDRPWKHALAAVVGLMAMYFSASWAIDSGRLLVYALTLFLIVYSVRHMILGAKLLYGK